MRSAAQIDVPLVNEVAADIFMGKFSGTFVRAAQVAGDLLRGSIYERYYGLAYDRVAAIDDVGEGEPGMRTSASFAALCRALAGETDGEAESFVARNGKVIEQEQILTTHNLASLWQALDLAGTLRHRLVGLALECFTWICGRWQRESRGRQRESRGRQTRLRAVKNSAYAWRQMLFFLSVMDEAQVAAFRDRMLGHLVDQPSDLWEHFRPAVAGLLAVLDGDRFDADGWHSASGGRRFLGWTTGTHWLLL